MYFSVKGQRSIIDLLLYQGKGVGKIRRELVKALGTEVPSETVRDRCNIFESGHYEVRD